MRRIPWPLVLSVVLGLQVLGLGVIPADAQTIKIGNLVDLTGPTSDQGKDIAQAAPTAFRSFKGRAGATARRPDRTRLDTASNRPRPVAASRRSAETAR